MATMTPRGKQNQAATGAWQDAQGIEQKVPAPPVVVDSAAVETTSHEWLRGPGTVPVVVAHFVVIDGIDRRPGDEIIVPVDLGRSLVQSGQARYLN